METRITRINLGSIALVHEDELFNRFIPRSDRITDGGTWYFEVVIGDTISRHPLSQDSRNVGFHAHNLGLLLSQWYEQNIAEVLAKTNGNAS